MSQQTLSHMGTSIKQLCLPVSLPEAIGRKHTRNLRTIYARFTHLWLVPLLHGNGIIIHSCVCIPCAQHPCIERHFAQPLRGPTLLSYHLHSQLHHTAIVQFYIASLSPAFTITPDSHCAILHYFSFTCIHKYINSHCTVLHHIPFTCIHNYTTQPLRNLAFPPFHLHPQLHHSHCTILHCFPITCIHNYTCACTFDIPSAGSGAEAADF